MPKDVHPEDPVWTAEVEAAMAMIDIGGGMRSFGT